MYPAKFTVPTSPSLSWMNFMVTSSVGPLVFGAPAAGGLVGAAPWVRIALSSTSLTPACLNHSLRHS
jgi:hypothetical protein